MTDDVPGSSHVSMANPDDLKGADEKKLDEVAERMPPDIERLGDGDEHEGYPALPGIEHIEGRKEQRDPRTGDVKLGAIPSLAERIEAVLKAARVWALTFGDAGTIITNGPPTESWTPAQHLECRARAAMTDALGALKDGTQLGLAKHVETHQRAFLGDPEMAALNARVTKLHDDDTVAPGSLQDRVRGSIAELSTLQQDLPDNSDARNTLAVILSAQGKLPDGLPIEAAPDRLFAQLVRAGVPIELVARAHAAAWTVVTARGSR